MCCKGADEVGTKGNGKKELAWMRLACQQVRKVMIQSNNKKSHARVWSWHPVANEEIYLSAFCGRGMPRPIGPRCGLLVAGKNEGKVSAFAWISSGRWVAQLHQRQGIHDLWLVGGDERGGFKRPMTYAYGDVQVGEQSRGSYQKK